MLIRHYILPLILALGHICALQAQDLENKARFHIQKCQSGVNYPTKGDESVDVTYGDHVFHLRILHPKVVEDLHFSSPFFWVSNKEKEPLFTSFNTVRSHVGALTWHSISGYFFAEKKGPLRGFFLEDGFDNWDNGSSGLIFLHDGKKSTAWRWVYDRDPEKQKGAYQIATPDKLAKPASPELIKTLSSILNLAEKEADAWPGP